MYLLLNLCQSTVFFILPAESDAGGGIITSYSFGR